MAATLAMAAMAQEDRGIFDTRFGVSHRDPHEGESDYERRQRLHSMNPVDLSEREFIIHGEAIMAHDRKTAMKIYANRHPETKKRKKK